LSGKRSRSPVEKEVAVTDEKKKNFLYGKGGLQTKIYATFSKENWNRRDKRGGEIKKRTGNLGFSTEKEYGPKKKPILNRCSRKKGENLRQRGLNKREQKKKVPSGMPREEEKEASPKGNPLRLPSPKKKEKEAQEG